MTTEEVRVLYEYDAWANHRLLDAAAALTPEQFTRDLGSSFSSVRDTLVHIMGAEWIWHERLRGKSPGNLLPTADFPDLGSVRTRWAEVERDLQKFVRALSQDDLKRKIEYRNLRGNTFAYPLGSILQHLANHGSYHRGQVVTMLRQLGAKGTSTDWLRYLDTLAGQPEE